MTAPTTAAETTAGNTIATFTAIPDGRAGVVVTLNQMRRLANAGKRDPRIREQALTIVRNVPQKDYITEARALFDFVKNEIRYVKDIDGVETLHSPDKILDWGQGDCDDKSLLLASLLCSIGHACRFVAVAFRGPGEFEHVFVQTLIGEKWWSAETTEDVEFGWSPQNIVDKITVYV